MSTNRYIVAMQTDTTRLALIYFKILSFLLGVKINDLVTQLVTSKTDEC